MREMEEELQAQVVAVMFGVGKLAAVVGAAWGLGQLVRIQMKELRLERAPASGGRAFPWPSLFDTLTFWATLLLGVAWVARDTGYAGSAALLEALFQLVAAGTTAAIAVIVMTSAGSTAISTKHATKVRLSVFLGVLTVAAIFLGASTAIVWLVLLGSVAAGVAALSRPAGRARISNAFADFAAGVRLVDLDVVGQEFGADDRRLRLLERGIVKSKLLSAGGDVMMRNELVLEMIRAELARLADENDDALTASGDFE